MQTLLRDLRFAIRQLCKSPGFAITAIITLALGIGATTAIFSLVNAVILRPLPFPEQNRLMWVQELDRSAIPTTLSYPDYFDWRAQNHSFSGLASYRHTSFTLTGRGPAEHLNGEIVSANFFRVLGVNPVVGRGFLPEEEKAGAHITVLSYGLWQSKFGGARDVIGRTIKLDGASYTVAGIMPAQFEFPIENPAPALWATLADDAISDSPPPITQQRGADILYVIGRLRPRVSIPQAREDLTLIAKRLAAQFPDTNKAYTRAFVQPELDNLVGNTRPALRVLFAAVTLLLLIACANIAGLLLARVSRRRSEMAVRISIGASRGEILRQILVESVVLSICGGVLGVALSSGLLKASLRFVPQNLPRMNGISLDGTVLVFVLAVSLATALLFGVAPAFRMSRMEPALALREGSRNITTGRGQNRLHMWLVVAETALGLILLIASGLLMRSFVRVLEVNPGFDARNVLTARLTLPEPRYTREKKIEFIRELISRVQNLPGVESTSGGVPMPLSNSNIGISFAIEGRPVAPGDEPSEETNLVTADFFSTMRIPVLRGRTFTARDDTNSKPVVIINEQFAQKYFPGEDPIGKRMKPDLGDGVIKSPMREIVGVVGNVKRTGLTADVDAELYLPWEQAVITTPTICIRTATNPASIIRPLRATVAQIDKDVPLFRVATLENSVYQAAAEPRFHTMLLALFATLALALSAVGLYAVLSYMVAQRTPEIGVRMAMGAQSGDVLELILRRGIALAAAGLALGIAASAVLTKFLSGMLYGIGRFDVITFAAATAVLLIISMIASGVPAYRAARLDPVTTLREQ